MPTPFDNAALTGPGSCGCHQQVFGGLVSDPGGLPEGAIAYADFKDGIYFYGGNELDDFLVEDTNWGSFDPLTAVESGVGLTSTTSPSPVLAPALAAELLASGFTAVIVWTNAPNCDLFFECTDLPGYTVETAILPDHTGFTQLKQLGTATELNMDYDVVAESQNRAALSFDFLGGATTMSLSVNGNPVGNLAAAAGAPHEHIAMMLLNAGVLESVVFYPLQIDAALPSLSAL
jgi:hypothetical protein